MSDSRFPALVRVLAHAVDLVPSAPTVEAQADAVALGLVVVVRRRGELWAQPSAWVEELLRDETHAGGQGLGRAVAVAVLEVLHRQPSVPELAHAVAAIDGAMSESIRPAAVQDALSLRLVAVPAGWRSPLRLTSEAEECVQAVLSRHGGHRGRAVRSVVEGACELRAFNRAQRR